MSGGVTGDPVVIELDDYIEYFRQAAIDGGIPVYDVDLLLGEGLVLRDDEQVKITLRIVCTRDHARCRICEQPIEPCGSNPKCVHVREGLCVKHMLAELPGKPTRVENASGSRGLG